MPPIDLDINFTHISPLLQFRTEVAFGFTPNGSFC
jgi:hypothetical protein